MNLNNLNAYSLFATTFLLLYSNKLKSQVIYTDMDPDRVLALDNEFMLINIDDNDSFDFLLLKTSGTWYTSYFETYFLHQDFAGPYYESNQIAGRLVTHGAGGASTYLAYKLQYGELIDESQITFYNAPGQQLASLAGNGIGIGYFAHDTTDGYLAVKFIDEASCYHYGWIRLAVVDSCRKMIIKDYAYEVECEHPIIAGSTEHYVGIDGTSQLHIDLNIYAIGNVVHICLPDAVSHQYRLKVYTIDGKIVYESRINAPVTQHTLIIPPGIYLLELLAGENKVVRKLLIGN